MDELLENASDTLFESLKQLKIMKSDLSLIRKQYHLDKPNALDEEGINKIKEDPEQLYYVLEGISKNTDQIIESLDQLYDKIYK